MLNWQIEQRKLELAYTWKISRNASDFKVNSIVTVSNGTWKGMGEGAPNIRYNETPEKMEDGFHRFISAGGAFVNDLEDLEKVLSGITIPNALRFAIESAYVHYLCHADKTDIFTFFGLQKPGAVHTSYSLPIMEPKDLAHFYEHYNLQRFQRLKLKVNADNALDLLDELNRITRQPLIIDGNETWKKPDEALKFMHALTPYNIALVEQPLPAGLEEEYIYLKANSPYLLFADESVTDHADFDRIKLQFHGVNMKLMKAGGYLNGIRILNEAVKHGLHTMVGCMIETTLGISSAMHLCAGVEYVDLDGFMIVKDEPYQLTLERNGMLFSSVDY